MRVVNVCGLVVCLLVLATATASARDFALKGSDLVINLDGWSIETPGPLLPSNALRGASFKRPGGRNSIYLVRIPGPLRQARRNDPDVMVELTLRQYLKERDLRLTNMTRLVRPSKTVTKHLFVGHGTFLKGKRQGKFYFRVLMAYATNSARATMAEFFLVLGNSVDMHNVIHSREIIRVFDSVRKLGG